MAGAVPIFPRVKFTDSSGTPIAGGFVTVYLAGTTTVTTTYQDSDMSTANESTITLDANGECLLFLDPNYRYKILLQSASGATVSGWPVDNIPAGTDIAALRAAVEVDMDAAVAAAEADADRAEVALDAILAASNIYADTTAGLAAVASGEYFMVPASPDYESLILYKDNAGTAVDTGKRILNAGHSSSYPDLEISLDALGKPYRRVDAEAEMYLGADTTSIQSHIRKTKSAVYKATGLAVGYGAETDTNGDAAEVARAVAQEMDTVDLLDAAYMNSDVMRLGDATYEMREPTPVQISRNHLLLFYCEVFYDYSRGVGDIDGARIMVRDITLDEDNKSITQTADRVIADNRASVGISPFPRAACTHYTVGRIRSGANAGRIFLIYATNSSAPNNNSTAMLPKYRYSDDDGQTWTAEAALTIASAASANIYSGLTKIIQLKYGANKGRLVSPHYIEPVIGTTKVVSVYSDDEGATWTMGTPGDTLGNEFYIAEDVDGTLYGIARQTAVAGLDAALLYTSSDGGETWVNVSTTLDGYGNGMSAVVQCSEETTGSPKMLRVYLNANGNTKATIALSYDGFTTVAGEVELQTAFSKYNGINMFNEQDWLVAVEAFTPAANGRGIMLYWGNLAYVLGL